MMLLKNNNCTVLILYYFNFLYFFNSNIIQTTLTCTSVCAIIVNYPKSKIALQKNFNYTLHRAGVSHSFPNYIRHFLRRRPDHRDKTL